MKKQSTKMSRAVSQLEHIYNALNADFFAGELPVPIVTVQSKPGTYGHCTTSKVWQRKDTGAYELNIAAEVLNFPILPGERHQRGFPRRQVPQRQIQGHSGGPRVDLRPEWAVRLEYHPR